MELTKEEIEKRLPGFSQISPERQQRLMEGYGFTLKQERPIITREQFQHRFGESVGNATDERLSQLAERMGAEYQPYHFTDAIGKKSPQPSTLDMAAMVGHGMGLGWGEDIASTLIGGARGVRRAIDTGDIREGMRHGNQTRKDVLATMQERVNKTREADPVASFLAESTGALTQGLGAIGKGALGVMAHGGVLGSGYGAGEARLDRTKDIFDEAVKGGVIGTGLAGGGYAVGKVAGNVIPRAKDYFTNLMRGNPQETGPAAWATREIGDTIRDSGVRSVGQIKRSLEKMGPEAMPVDAPELRQLGQHAGVQGPEGAPLRMNLDKRARTASRRLGQLRDKHFGPEVDLEGTRQAMKQTRQQRAGPMWDKAYANPAEADRQVIRDVIQTPTGRKALKNAQNMAADEGKEFNLRIVKRKRDDGTTYEAMAGRPKTYEIDLLHRALNDMVGSIDNAGATNQQRLIRSLEKKVVGSVDNPDWTAARDEWSRQMGLKDALDLGGKVDSRAMPHQEYDRLVKGLDDEGKQMAIQGARNVFDVAADNSKNPALAARGPFEKRGTIKKTASLVGKRAAIELARGSRTERVFGLTKSKINDNSQTEFRRINNPFDKSAPPNQPGLLARATSAAWDKAVKSVMEHRVGQQATAMARKLSAQGAARDQVMRQVEEYLAREAGRRLKPEAIRNIATVITNAIAGPGAARMEPLSMAAP